MQRGLHSTPMPVVPTTAFQDLFGSKGYQVEDGLKRTCVENGSMEMTYSTPPPLGGVPKGHVESTDHESRHWDEEKATQSEEIVHALRDSKADDKLDSRPN